jgi:hypothetical protein
VKKILVIFLICFIFSEFAPTKRLPQLIGDPINRNAQQLTREILGKTGEGVHSLKGR